MSARAQPICSAVDFAARLSASLRPIMGSFEQAVATSDLTTDPRVITDALPPFRIVHANQSWCQTTGYTPSMLEGSSCKILQGPETCVRTLQVRSLESRKAAVPYMHMPTPAAHTHHSYRVILRSSSLCLEGTHGPRASQEPTRATAVIIEGRHNDAHTTS